MKAKKNIKLLNMTFSGLILLLILSSILLLYRNQGVSVDNFAHDLLLPQAYARHYDDLLTNMPSINHVQSNQTYPSTAPFFPANAQVLASTEQDQMHDTLTLSYQGSDSSNVFNCENSLLKANEQTTSFYYLNKNHQFMCALIKNGKPDFASERVLIENVDAVQLRFGEKNRTGKKKYKRFQDIQHIEHVNRIEITILLRMASPAQSIATQERDPMNPQTTSLHHDNIPRKVIRFNFPVQHIH